MTSARCMQAGAILLRLKGVVNPVAHMFFLGLVRLLSVPFDRGANMRGAAAAPALIHQSLVNAAFPAEHVLVNTTKSYQMLQNTYLEAYRALDAGRTVCTLGGDHAVAVGSVAAANDICQTAKQTLGVLWIDAHADFNTPETSPTQNVHGMVVSILCGHCLHPLHFGYGLDCQQFAYFGVRDVDALELQRLQEHNMRVLDSVKDLADWIQRWDVIHVSFDMDACDPIIAPGVSTPVSDGLRNLNLLLSTLRDSGKVRSMDCVETNPSEDVDGATVKLAADIIRGLLG